MDSIEAVRSPRDEELHLARFQRFCVGASTGEFAVSLTFPSNDKFQGQPGQLEHELGVPVALSTTQRNWSARDLLDHGRALRRPPAEVLNELKPILIDDMVTEFDGRFLMEYVQERPFRLTREAEQAYRLWARDEERHYAGFRLTLESLYDNKSDPEGEVHTAIRALKTRSANFEPLAHFFEEEFSLLVLSAYDELCTVRGYRKNLELYDQLGPKFGRYLRNVIADEAHHYSLFLNVLRSRHSHRLSEATHWITQARAAEDAPYQATFLLDHDDSELYSDDICDQAARILLRQLRS